MLVVLVAGCLGPPRTLHMDVGTSFSLDETYEDVRAWALPNGSPASDGLVVGVLIDRTQVPDRTIVGQSNGTLQIQVAASTPLALPLDKNGHGMV
ncbi:MAG: hypothetical protein LC624_10040, partial [Halobacteriales archaeon]|nr:hypothetical protein [Halobacteriales archaeon]